MLKILMEGIQWASVCVKKKSRYLGGAQIRHEPDIGSCSFSR